jgi:hypothetical protein
LRIAEIVIEGRDGRDDVVEELFFAAERLGILRVVPDGRVFEFLVDFF